MNQRDHTGECPIEKSKLPSINLFDGVIYCYGSKHWNYIKVGRSCLKELSKRLNTERNETTCPDTHMFFLYLSSNYVGLETRFKQNFKHLMINQKELFMSSPLDSKLVDIFKQFLIKEEPSGFLTSEDDFYMVMTNQADKIKNLFVSPTKLSIDSKRLEKTSHTSCSEGNRLHVLVNMFGAEFDSSILIQRNNKYTKNSRIRTDILFHCRKSNKIRSYTLSDLKYDIVRGSIKIVE